MELLEAIKRFNQLDSDVQKLEEWLGRLSYTEKPVTGRTWLKLKKAIDNVIGDIAEERNALEEQFKSIVLEDVISPGEKIHEAD